MVGLKPSRGRVSLGPDFGEIWPGMLQEFVLTRTVRDTALMLDAVSKPILGDPFIIVQPSRPYMQEVGAPTKSLRIAWTADSWKPGSPVDPEVVNCMEQVVSKCEQAGHKLVEARAPSWTLLSILLITFVTIATVYRRSLTDTKRKSR